MQEKCDVCQRDIPKDGFCAWHGPMGDVPNQQWMCDDCVHATRGRGQQGLHAPNPSSPAEIKAALGQIESCIRNMAMISSIKGMDASTAERSFNVALDWRDSKAIYKIIYLYLEGRLEEKADA